MRKWKERDLWSQKDLSSPLGLPLPVCCLSFSFLFHSRGEKSQFTKQQREFREITECFGTWLDPLYLNCVHVLSRDQIFETPWTVARRLLCPWYFPGKKYCNGLPFPTPEDLPDPGTEPASLVLSALAGGFFTTEPPGKSGYLNLERVEVLVLGCAWERPRMMWGSNLGHHLLNVVGWLPPSSCHLVGSNEQNSSYVGDLLYPIPPGTLLCELNSQAAVWISSLTTHQQVLSFYLLKEGAGFVLIPCGNHNDG